MITETFLKDKGKLEVESPDQKERKVLIFDYAKKQIFVQDLVANACQAIRIQHNQDFLGNYVFPDSKSNVSGPTAIFNKLVNSQKVSEFKSSDLIGALACRLILKILFCSLK